MLTNLRIKTRSRNELIDITNEVQNIVQKCEIQSGLCLIYVPHTTAGVLINENADPSVTFDIINTLDKIIPWNGDYMHLEGNSAAHLKSVITGSSVQVIIDKNNLLLGTWQGIFFAEFDGPRERNVIIKLMEC